MAKNLARFCGFLVLVALLAPIASPPCFASEPALSSSEAPVFPPELQSYDDSGQSILTRLAGRIEANPFNLVGTVIFLLAILHTFFSSRLSEISHRLEYAHERRVEEGTAPLNSVCHSARLLHGGLTVIANAPNPAGQAILKGYFDGGVSPVGLVKAALIPTLIVFSMFMIFR